MFNNHVAGADMLVAAAQRLPSYDLLADTGGVARADLELASCYGFREGDRFSVFLLNKKLDGAHDGTNFGNGHTPVTVHLPFTNVTGITLYKLVGDPRLTNREQLNFQIVSQNVSTANFSPAFAVNADTGGETDGMPAGIFLYQFEGCSLPALPVNAQVTVSQAATQPDPQDGGDGSGVRFLVVFDRPVTGFGAESGDVVLGGTAGARVFTVTEVFGSQGTLYEVAVSGFSSAGTVTVTVPAGAAQAVADGQPNAASTSSDNEITVTGDVVGFAIWGNVAGETNWLSSASWNDGYVPGPNDVAVFPEAATINAQPSLAGVSNVNALKIPGGKNVNGGAADGWTINGSGTLTIKGKPGTSGLGIHTPLTSDQWWSVYNSYIYPNVVLGGPQLWRGRDTRTLTLYGNLSGTGPLAVSGEWNSGQFNYNHVHTYVYRGSADPSFTGGLSLTNAIVNWDLTGQSADRTVQFGTGPITLANGPGVETRSAGLKLSGPRGEFDFWTTNTAASLVTLTLTNDLIVDPSGGLLYSWQKGTAPYTRNVFGGTLSLNGPLRLKARATATSASSTRFTGSLAVNAAVACTAGLYPGYDTLYNLYYSPEYDETGYGALDFDGTIADGAGPFRNPLVIRSRQRALMTINGAGNSYAGGTVVEQGGSSGYQMFHSSLSVGAGGVLGTGDAAVLPGGRLRLAAASNLASGKKVRVESTEAALGVVAVTYNGIPALDAISDGVLAIDGVNPTVAIDQSAIGNGKMFFGAVGAQTCGLATLLPGSDKVYRLGGGWDKQNNTPWLTFNNAAFSLADVGGACAVQVGALAYNGVGYVTWVGHHTFSGDLTIRGPFDYAYRDGGFLEATARATAGQTPLGAATGNVKLQLGQLKLVGVSSGQKVNKNRLTFEAVSRVILNSTATGSGYPTYLEFDSLVRTNGGALVFDAQRDRAQGMERFTVTNGAPAMVNGMVAPYYVSAVDGGSFNYATYDAVTGFGKFTSYAAMPAPGTGTEVVSHTGAVSGSPSIWALKTTGALTGSGTITINGGGLMIGGDNHHIAPSLDFGPAEGVIFSLSTINNPANVSGKISGSGGLTLLGNALWLSNTNNDFAGLITVTGGAGSGVLVIEPDVDGNTGKTLGHADNDIFLNGGMLRNKSTTRPTTLPATRTITLGPLGGVLQSTFTINGNITGPGPLKLWTSWSGFANGITLNSATPNDYAGGTHVNGFLTVNADSSLGTGDVLMDYGILTLKGNANLPTAARLYASLDTTVLFQSAAPAVGSLAGAGKVQLGATGVDTTLTVGQDNTDCAFYGTISQASGRTCGVTKQGSGTWTLHGAHRYTGLTTVNAGALALRGSLAGGLTVGANGALKVRIGPDGKSSYGAVAGAVTLGGTLQIDVEDGFKPLPGDSWTLLAGASEITGGFTSISDPTMRVSASGGTLTLTRAATATTITLR
jgi:autotransporter-associated beta strand protein